MSSEQLRRDPTSKVRSSGCALLDQLCGDTPCPRLGAAAALCWTSHREIPHVQGQEQRLHFARTAVKRYPMSKVRETQVRR